MKLHLNLSLRRALLSAMAVACTLGSQAFGGMVDARYDLQYYLDFSYNKGMFSAGATNILVKYADGTSVTNAVIPIMPNLDCYVEKGTEFGSLGGLSAHGGGGLVAPQYVMSAAHCLETDVFFLTENGNTSTKYTSTGYRASGSWGIDWSVQRLNKIVTEVAYTPFATNEFMSSLTVGTWMYRLGHGKFYNTSGEVLQTNQNALGGLINLENNLKHLDANTWEFITHIRKDDTSGDVRPPLEIGGLSGDSGSPIFAWDDANNRFVQVAFASAGTLSLTYGNDIWCRYNATDTQNFIDDCTIAASGFKGENVITWGAQDSATGKGTLTQVQGDETVSLEYVGKGSDNAVRDQMGLTFSTEDTTNVQTLALQSSVDMGAGAMTFDSGSWKITETQESDTFNSAGFVVNKGASVTLELTATASEEWRKVGEGILTIAGEGNNEAVLRVGGGTTVYNVTRDADGNITGCTLGNAGETRLNRTDGYAASSVRLEGGVAILVLMQDDQFKTNSQAGDTFTFGNAGGLLNLNGHDLEWEVLNQSGSGTGARIGNFTPEGLDTPGLATFTYTGTGTFAGCFMDEGAGDDKAQLAVVYNNAADGSWKLTGNHTNVGGFTVKGGTMVLEGSLTSHVNTSDANDWTYASLEGSDVTIENGATFQLSHHAVMTGNVSVQDGGAFILNQTVNAASESVQGSLRQDMAELKLTSLVGNVDLYGSGTMTVNTESPVVTTMKGNITQTDALASDASYFVKEGSGVFVVDGSLSVVRGTVNAGGLVATDASPLSSLSSPQWTIGEQGFMAFGNVDNDEALTYVSTSSSGVLALTSDQASALDLRAHTNLIIGAWGTVNYGSADATLGTVYDEASGRNVWRLGGGTGTLNVLFKLTGEADVLIGNEWSSGTVHLANANNDFNGSIYLSGLGNLVSFAEGALGENAQVVLSYGNAISLTDASQVSILAEGTKGVVALPVDADLDLSSTKLSLGAKGDFTYTKKLSVADMYRFGGIGNLTLDTTLDSADAMQLDGQGMSGSSVTFARENAYSGSIAAGGGLELTEANSQGDIAIHAGHEKAFAATASVTLQKGATLYTDGQNLTVRNLTLESGAVLRNNGSTLSQVTLDVSDSQNTSFADGVLNSGSDTSQLNLIKTGTGTLTMAHNADWTGTLVINEGTVVATTTGEGYVSHGGGIGSNDSVIWVNSGGTLHVNMRQTGGAYLGGTAIQQTLRGTGTVALSSGGAVLFSTQGSSLFTGTVALEGNTRLYLGDLNYNGSDRINTLNAVANATVSVSSGSQVRVTNALRYELGSSVSTTADFVISGNGFSGSDHGIVREVFGTKFYLTSRNLNEGALSIDNMSTVKGNITLAADATIASNSYNAAASGSSSVNVESSYGTKEKLGGIIRGRILGATGSETLTIGGNEGLTITADSANTFGDLVLSNGNGNNTDKFALRLNGGQALSQESTALGTGTVTVESGLILRLAGTGTANNTDINYIYANAFKVDDNATLQSYNITNTLTGTVTMQGDTLNLATAQGGVLVLAGGIQGEGTLNVGADSSVVLGSASSTMSLARTTTPQFSGTVAAAAGADITLASPAAVSTDTEFSGTDSLTLRLGGQEDYTLGGISVSDSDTTDDVASALTLYFDFTNTPDAGDVDTWTTLTSTISAGTTSIALELNMFNDIAKGEYKLISSIDSLDGFTLADTMNGRLSLTMSDGALVLTVGNDNRLYWRTGQASSAWNASDANWYSDDTAGMTTFTNGADVVLDGDGVASGNSSSARETITVEDALTVGTLAAQDAAYEISGEGSVTADTLAVGEGGDLKLSNTGGNAFTNGVQLDDGKLEVSGNTLTADVNAVNGSTLTLSNSATMSGALTVDRSTVSVNDSSLNGNVSLTGTASLEMENGTLNGTLTSDTGSVTLTTAKLSGDLSNGSEALQSTELTIHSGSVTTNAALDMGTLTLEDGSLQINGKADIDKLSIAAGKTVTLWNATAAAGADKVLGMAELANGSVLQTNDREQVTAATSIGTLKLTGASATLRDQHHSGYYSVGALSMDDSLSSATINLVKIADSTLATVVNLGGAEIDGGNFKGQIVLNSDTGESGDSDRSLFLVLGGSQAAAGAVVNMSAADSSTAVLGLGINTDTTTIAGLSSASGLGSRAKVFSGSVETKTQWGSGSSLPSTVGDAVRTLTIQTASGADNSFYGEILGSVNLVIDGEGTQRFLGTSSSFNGSVTVQGGTAAFDATGSSLLSAASSVTVGSGTLDLSAIDFTNSANAIALANNAAFSFDSDSTVALCALEADTQYTIFDVGTGSLSGWPTLTASNFTLDGVKLTDYGRVELTLGLMGSFSYTITDGWDLVWDGGAESATWNQVDTNQVWLTDTTDDSTGETSTVNIGFKNNDNVTFKSDADLSLEGNIRVNNMSVADNVSLKTVGNLTVTGDLSIGSGVSWDFSGDTTLSFTEAELKAAGNMVVGEGATLKVTDMGSDRNTTSDALDKVSGSGTVVLDYTVLSTDNGVGFDFSGLTGTVQVESGRVLLSSSVFGETHPDFVLNSSNSQLVFSSTTGTELKGDVTLNASTTFYGNNKCYGTISGEISGSGKTLTKAGAGSLTLAGKTSLGGLTVTGGKVKLSDDLTLDGSDRLQTNAGTTLQLDDGVSINRTNKVACWFRGSVEVLENATAELKSVDDVHLNYDNSSGTGKIVLNKNSELTMTVNKLTFYTGGSVSLSENAELKLTKSNVHISNKGTDAATVTATNGQLYSMSNANFTMTNAHVKSVAISDSSLANTLTNSSVENAGSGVLTVSNSVNKITDVYASAGDMNILQQAVGMELGELVVAEEKTVSIYTGTEAATANEADVKVAELARFERGATLNANLILSSGATLEVGDGGLAMGSTLTLNSGVLLGDATLARVKALSVGESTTLFTGVDGLTLDGTTVTDVILEPDARLASAYFSNLDSSSYVVTYTATADGNSFGITMMSIPEPTTSMLGLVGLVALTFRRRRK